MKNAHGERGREDARAGSGEEAKTRGGQWGGRRLVVVEQLAREASKAANVVAIVLVSSLCVTDCLILFRLANI